jgi:hypothetical protein
LLRRSDLREEQSQYAEDTVIKFHRRLVMLTTSNDNGLFCATPILVSDNSNAASAVAVIA